MFIGCEVLSFRAFLLMSCRSRPSSIFIEVMMLFWSCFPLLVIMYLRGPLLLILNVRFATIFSISGLALGRLKWLASLILDILAPGSSHCLRIFTITSNWSLYRCRPASVRVVVELALIHQYTAHPNDITVHKPSAHLISRARQY